MSDERYVTMTEHQRANVQGIIDLLTETGEAIGGFTSKCEACQTGAGIYVTFEKRVDVQTALTLVRQFEQSPALLADACKKLLLADALIAAHNAQGQPDETTAQTGSNGGEC